MMGYRYYGNAMNWSGGNLWIASLTWAVILIDLVLLGVFLWKQINKK